MAEVLGIGRPWARRTSGGSSASVSSTANSQSEHPEHQAAATTSEEPLRRRKASDRMASAQRFLVPGFPNTKKGDRTKPRRASSTPRRRRSSLASDAFHSPSSAFLTNDDANQTGTGLADDNDEENDDENDDDGSAYSWEFTISSSHHGSSTGGGGGGGGGAAAPNHTKRSAAALHRGAGQPPGRSGFQASSPPGVRRVRFSRPTGPNRRLADLTINKVQFVKLGRLYGRDAECQLLRDAWDAVRQSWRRAHLPDAATADPPQALLPSRLAADGAPPRSSYSRRFVSIAGASGTGKSTLAETLREPVLKAGGFFLLGKFPQQHGLLSRHAMQPYAAFEAACNDLCELLVSLYTPQSEEDNSSNHNDDTHGSSSYNDSHSGRGFGEDEESTVFSWRHLKVTLAHVRKRLHRDLGADAAILTRVIPSLLQVLGAHGGASAAEESIGYREAHHQFKFAFRRFLRAIASFGPVVLVLDDLQWADAASMELMEALVSDRENPALLVIGCYRDDIEYGAMPHLATLESVQAMATPSEDGNTDDLRCDRIAIGNLAEVQVHQLLVDLLSLAETETRDLAECVHKRTLGNIFFVIQYVTMLQDAELLQYNIGASKWTFDLEAIRVSTAATDNVVSLMTNKMKRLPRRLQHFLPVMACLGTTFNVSVFVLLFRHFADEQGAETALGLVDETSHNDAAEQVTALARKQTPQECLADCEEEGFIVSSLSNASEALYQWVHDKIQEAAFSLVSDDELSALRLEIGRVLFEKLEPSSLDQNIFTVVNLITTERMENLPLSPVQVARLCLAAGTKTMENSAFEQAAGYLAKGIGLLPTKCWNDHYHLTLELYSTAAEAEFCVGNFARMRLYCNQVLDQTERPMLEKRRAYNVLLDGTAAEEGTWAAFAFCRSLLAKLGCHFPKTKWGVNFHVRAVIMLIRLGRTKYTASETISQLSLMDDETKQWLMVLLHKFSAFTYLTIPAMLPLVIFKGLRLTMAHGVSDSAPTIFSFVGLLLAAFVNDFKGGQAFADQAIALLKVVRHARKNECKVVYLSHALVLHWTRPASLSIKPLLSSYEVGMAMGDTASACWAIYFHIVFSFRTGTSLKVLLEECDFYADVMREVKQRAIVLDMLLNLWQVMLHLTGANLYSGLLDGDVRNQEDALRSVKKENYETLRSSLLMRQSYVAFVLGRHEIVYEIIRLKSMENGCYEKIFAGILDLGHLYGCNGLSMMSLYHRTKDTKYLKLAKCFAKKIKRWVGAGNPNFVHYDALLDAELKSSRGQNLAAATLYQVAITFAGRSGLTQDRALGHERYGEHLCRLGLDYASDAEFHLKEAVRLYDEWGAHAKVEHIHKVHGERLGSSRIQIELPVVFRKRDLARGSLK